MESLHEQLRVVTASRKTTVVTSRSGCPAPSGTNMQVRRKKQEQKQTNIDGNGQQHHQHNCIVLLDIN
jgi:hypothetical protein